MRQCTATTEVPPTDVVIAILARLQRVTDEDLSCAYDMVRCELGLWHRDEHAGFVWGKVIGEPVEGLWARWAPDGGAMRFEFLPWCETEGGSDDDACTLYQDHDREHSWNVSDPKVEAFRRQVLAENAGLIARLTSRRD